MLIGDDEIRQRLRLGEDSAWEFKQIHFNGDRPISPRRDDLADEITAFANARGGYLLCGVTDDGFIQGITPKQAREVSRLLVDVSEDVVKPALQIDVYHQELDGKVFVLAKVPRGSAVHERGGRAFIRSGATKRPLDGDRRLRLAQDRAQSRFVAYDRQIVPNTGFNTLCERLWEPLLSAAGSHDPRRGLMNLRLLARDELGIERATVAGVLLCTQSPQEWLPHAVVMATHYRGRDRASGQFDAQEITGPLPLQIADTVKFIVRNMRMAARKLPARENLPQYDTAALFEAVVNAVVHRDYSNHSRRIRLSMFKEHLEIDSPGQLPNGMVIESMDTSQATRNEVIASVFGRISAANIPGSDHRLFLMERRGDGVSIIKTKTKEVSGSLPQYTVVDESNLVLSIPAAKLVLSPAESAVTVHSAGEPLSGVDILVLFPNKTWQRATTDETGEAVFDLYTSNLPMAVYAAAPGYGAGLKREWMPKEGGLLMELDRLPDGGAVIFAEDTGHLPGLQGRLNPIRDSTDRMYMYADNIAIEEGRRQPVYFRLGKPMQLTDAFGYELSVTIVDIIGRSALVEYREIGSRNPLKVTS